MSRKHNVSKRGRSPSRYKERKAARETDESLRAAYRRIEDAIKRKVKGGK